MDNSGMLVIISGPSGSGKGTVVKRLDPAKGYALSISMTTRNPRKGETHGKDYFFASREEFLEIRKENGFLEHAEFCGNMYGTPKSYVNEQIQNGKKVILEIDVNGALQIKDLVKDCILIFLMPPTKEELQKRLIGRKTEDEETIKKRLIRAHDEIELVYKYDYLVINDDIDQAVSDIYSIIDTEFKKPIRSEHRIKKFKGEI